MSYLAKAREPISSLSHCIGAVVFAAATLLLVGKTLFDDWSPKILVGVIVFGVSLVALYSASAIYHFSNGSAKRILRLRKLDHSMIYVLIAGSYTPILLKYLPQHESLVFVSVIWGCAVLGVVIKLCWFSAPRWLQTLLYIAMGWAVLFDVSVFRDMSGAAVLLLALGRHHLHRQAAEHQRKMGLSRAVPSLHPSGECVPLSDGALLCGLKGRGSSSDLLQPCS